jgi:acetyl esterase/lipase
MLNVLLRVSLKRMLSKADVKMLRLAVGPIIGRLSLGFNPVVPRKIRAHDAHIDAVRAEWILPSRGHTSRVLLYLPGGGFFLPATQHHRKFVSRLGRAIRARGLLAHYRLAPDYPFPAGLEDAVAAYRHLLTDGIDPKRIVIVGDSAGGGLTLSTLLALRDAGQPLPAAAIVLSPLADLTYSGASRTYNRWRDPMLPTQRAVNLNDIYLKDVPAELSLVSPIFGDYTGLPPILAQVGSTEMLLDDTLRMAARARAHAVAVEVEVWRDMPHGWQLIDLLPESGQAIKHIGDFVRRHVPDISGVTTGTRVKRADVSAQQLRRARRRKAARSARQRALLAGMAPT